MRLTPELVARVAPYTGEYRSQASIKTPDEVYEAAADRVFSGLPPSGELWVFAYGSLMWKSGPEFGERGRIAGVDTAGYPHVVLNVVTQAHYCLMATSVRTRESDAGYGLGLFVDQVEGETRVGHTGGTFGFTSAEKYFPKHRVQLIAFTNSGDDAPEPGEVLTQAIYDDLYPDIAAAAALPSGAVEARTLSTAKEIFASLQSGTYDYSHFSDGIGAKLKSGFAAGWMKSFSGYGSPTRFVFKGSRVSPGRRWSDYLIKFGPGCYLKFGFAVDDDGKVASLSLG